MPQATDKSNANTLPDPELNPLLNPLLAAHMGRWAEVYFTNPPEKRGQAVSDLLRELENIAPPEPAPPIASENPREKPETPEWLNSSAAGSEPALVCTVCAHKNSAGQRFCGMCAAPLQVSPVAHVPEVAEPEPMAGASWCERSLGNNAREDRVEEVISMSAAAAADRYQVPEPARPLPEERLSHFSVEFKAVPGRYQLYVGAVLATLLLVLGYMAWRGTKAVSGTASPQSTAQRTTSPAQPAAATTAPPARAMPSASPTNAATPSPAASDIQPETNSQKNEAADSQAAARIVPVAANSSAPPAPAQTVPAQSGAVEMAMAQKYLNGGPGVTRDSGEAAQWLWKAVAKGNATATIALSDLYLRGDGVTKSCDPARLLLDAAAAKAQPAAAERLRNLQAFGCQ